MSAAQSIAGRVVCQQDGRPVPYATVQALVQGRGGVKRSTASQTDAAGRFSLIVPGFEVAGQRPAAVFVDVEFEGELVGRSQGVALGRGGEVAVEIACKLPAERQQVRSNVAALAPMTARGRRDTAGPAASELVRGGRTVSARVTADLQGPQVHSYVGAMRAERDMQAPAFDLDEFWRGLTELARAGKPLAPARSGLGRGGGRP